MPTWTGSLNSSGSPVINISVCGAFPQVQGSIKQFDAIVDTGFSGFLSLPLFSAFPLAVTLFGTTWLTLADGSQVARLLAIGSVIVGNESQAGIIILEPNSTELLIGMDLLKRFRKKLVVVAETGTVLLEDVQP